MGDPSVTIGVAIGVPEPDATALAEVRRRSGDRLADSVRTHITVVGPRVVARAELPAICAHLERVAATVPAYDVLLEGTDTFRPTTQVVFVRVAGGAGECARLATRVRSGPLADEADGYPYHPHVTLAHDVPADRLDEAQAALAGYRLAFPVDAVWLYVCGSDGVWRPERSFALAGRD